MLIGVYAVSEYVGMSERDTALSGNEVEVGTSDGEITEVVSEDRGSFCVVGTVGEQLVRRNNRERISERIILR